MASLEVKINTRRAVTEFYSRNPSASLLFWESREATDSVRNLDIVVITKFDSEGIVEESVVFAAVAPVGRVISNMIPLENRTNHAMTSPQSTVGS
jgi:hypothetical protein